MSTRRRSLAIVLFLSLLATARAWAQPADAAAHARDLYASGTTHYNLREYGDALSDFKNAYRIRPDPVFLFNIAQCYRQLGDAEQASSYYRAFRREVPDASNRDEVDRLITEMDKAAAARRANLPPSGPQPPPTVSPTPAPTETPAVPPVVPAHGEATQPASASNTLVAGPPPKRPLTRRGWFWGVIVGGAVVVGGAVALGIVLGQPHAPTPTLGHLEGP